MLVDRFDLHEPTGTNLVQSFSVANTPKVQPPCETRSDNACTLRARASQLSLHKLISGSGDTERG